MARLAVLADDDADGRPADFSSNLFGCQAGIRGKIRGGEAALKKEGHFRTGRTA
ncbi:MAG: hypothetical protein ACRELG_27015 [Gemmataceae bacterium]